MKKLTLALVAGLLLYAFDKRPSLASRCRSIEVDRSEASLPTRARSIPGPSPRGFRQGATGLLDNQLPSSFIVAHS